MEISDYYLSTNIGAVSASPCSTSVSTRCFFPGSRLPETLSQSGN